MKFAVDDDDDNDTAAAAQTKQVREYFSLNSLKPLTFQGPCTLSTLVVWLSRH